MKFTIHDMTPYELHPIRIAPAIVPPAGHTVPLRHLRAPALRVVKFPGSLRLGRQPGFFLTTRSAGARRWCDRRSCPEGVMMWVPFGQLKNKLHRYDPDKGRGVGIGILYLSVKSVVKTPGLDSWRWAVSRWFLTQGRRC